MKPLFMALFLFPQGVVALAHLSVAFLVLAHLPLGQPLDLNPLRREGFPQQLVQHNREEFPGGRRGGGTHYQQPLHLKLG